MAWTPKLKKVGQGDSGRQRALCLGSESLDLESDCQFQFVRLRILNDEAVRSLFPIQLRFATEQRDRLDLAIKQLSKIGLPADFEKRIRFERVITPADWESKVDVYRGATFNLAHNFSQMLHLRPRNRFEEFDGMYLVGGGTHPGSGLPVIFESARISSKLVLKDLN